MKTNKMYTILFICSGNSCRSPMAEGLLKKMLYEKYGDNVKIHSSGTLGINNNPATINAINVAKEKGVDISSHKSKALTKKDMGKSDLIFVMAENHKDYLDFYHYEFKENTYLLKMFATESDKPHNISIDDPIGQNLSMYRKIINEIEKELIRINDQLIKLIDYKLDV